MRKDDQTRLDVFAWSTIIYTVGMLVFLIWFGLLSFLPLLLVGSAMMFTAYVMAYQQAKRRGNKKRRSDDA